MSQEIIFLTNILDQIGFYGPFIILVITTYSLWSQEKILIFYLIFAFINIYFNRALKILIKQPRPKGFDEETNITKDMEIYKYGDEYGMPSGHSNLSFYSIFFNYQVKDKITNTMVLMIVIAMITIAQRYKFKKHTLQQLFVGGIVGIIYSYVVFKITKIFIKNYI